MRWPRLPYLTTPDVRRLGAAALFIAATLAALYFAGLSFGW